MRIFFFVIVAWIVFSCDDTRHYEANKDFSDRTWKVNDTTSFDFRVTNLQERYNIYLNVRNSLDYPNARLFVNVQLTDSLGNQLEKKLSNQDLFDQKTGKPNGSSSLGDIYDHRFMLWNAYEFKRTGRYYLKLEQFMRQDTLPGILAVGTRIEKASLQTDTK